MNSGFRWKGEGMTKIEELKKLQYDMANNKYIVQLCLGKRFDKEENKYVVDSKNDKHDFNFSKNSHHSSKSIYLDAYYGYYGSLQMRNCEAAANVRSPPKS